MLKETDRNKGNGYPLAVSESLSYTQIDQP